MLEPLAPCAWRLAAGVLTELTPGHFTEVKKAKPGGARLSI